MEAVIIAVITAIVSISVALIQAVSAFRIASLKAQPAQETIPTNKPVTPGKALTLSRTWLWVTGILIVSNFLWQVFFPLQSGQIIHLAAIPWCTCLLAYFRPIRWGYVAGVITLLSIIPVVTAYFTIGSYYYDITALPLLSLIFAANAVLATGIAYQRLRASVAK